MAPGWKLAPVQVTGAGNASASFPATAGELALLVVQETTGAPAQGFKAEAKLNSGDKVPVSRQKPLAAKVVELIAINGLELTVEAGGARASVAALALPPCAAVEARVTHAGGKTPTVETRTFSWAAGAGPALLVLESGGAKKVKGRVQLGTVEVKAPNENQPPAVEVVTPQASNTLRVEVEGDAGAWVRVVVLEPDMLPPLVSMEQPEDGARLSSSPVVVQGTAGAGAVAAKVGTVEAVLSQGQYTAQVPLVEGPNALVAEARDQCGNVARVCRSVVLDARPPSVVIEGVTEGQVSREPLSPTWKVQSSGPATVDAKLDGAPFVSGTPVSAEGAHELVVVARDGAGREATARAGFAIDTTPPGLTLSGVEEGQRRNTPAVLEYTVEEVHPGTVEATLDGAPMSSGDTVVAEGSHEWVVVATDVAGNRAEARRHFVVDLTPPTLEVLAPAPGSYLQAGTVEVVVGAGDAGPLAGVWLGTAELMLGADGKYRSNVPLEEGSNLLVLVARDVAGNSTRSTLVVTRDSTAPQLTVTSPAEGAKVAGDLVQVEGQVEDATPLTVRVAGLAAAVGADGRFQHALSVAQGAVSVEVVATDAAGNTARLVRSFRANASPPRLDLTAPASGTVTEEPSIEVSGFARAADRTDTVKLEVAGGEHAVRADGSFTLQVPLVVGPNTVSVTAVDGYGLRTTRTVRVERQGPQEPGPGPGDGGTGGGSGPDGGSDAPDAGSPGPTPDGGVTDEPPVLVLASPEEGSLWGVDRVAVLGRVVGGTLPLEVTVDGLPATVTGRQFSAALALPEGSTVLHVRAVDALGRVTEARRQVRVDQTPPFLEVTRPEQPETTVSESPYLVEGMAGDAYLGGVTVNGSPVLVLAGRFSASVPLVAGANTVEVEAVDLAGNRSRATRILTVEGLPPRLTVLEPAQGSEALTPVVRVMVQVEASAPLAEVRIGTGVATEAGSGRYTAQVPLALGENVISLVARDTLGLTGTASVRVRYRDPNIEPLTVTGVDPSDQATELEPDTLVNVAFNKPVQPGSARVGFTVSAEGVPLPGGWSIAPGGQIVSFIARDPLPEGATLQVRVAGVEPVQGPGMAGEFRSMFTVRRPLTRLRGQVVDERREPLSGVRVEVEGQGLVTRTGVDGNWALFGVRPGRVVLRYEGGSSSEGRAYPTVRRRFPVEAERDNVESTVQLTPIEAESAEPVDTSVPLHLTFGGRHGALEVDIPAGGLLFEGGSARGLVTATRLPLHALPVGTEGSMRAAVVWQLQPAGTRLARPVELRLPNLLQGQPGSRALLFAYDPDEHLLRIAGLASLSEDGTQLVSDGPIEAGSLEYFGYLPLPEEASAALAAASGTPGTLPGPLNRSVHQGWGTTPGGVLDYWEHFLNFIHPILVVGTIRGPREQAVALDLSAPSLGEKKVQLDPQLRYRMPFSVKARTLIPRAPTDVGKSLVVTLEGVGPGGQRLGPPSGSSWRQESPEGQQVELSTEVELSLGSTALVASGSTSRGRNVLRLNAELSLEDGGVTDGGFTPGVLRLGRADGGSSGVEETEGVVRFGGLPVTVTASWFEGASVSGPTGRYAAPTLVAQAFWLPTPLVQACTPLPVGWTVQSWVGADGRVQTRKVPFSLDECSGLWEAWGGDYVSPVDILIDARWLHGTVTLVDRKGAPLPPACGTQVEREGTEVVELSADDVRTTEVHFFREDDPSTPIVSYAAVDPFACEGTTGRPHGRYAKVRIGPSTLNFQLSAARRNRQRLLPGDRLVVFAINHATGHAGMEVVTVPSVNRSSRAEDGSCPADDAAGGPLSVQDGNRTVSLSRCTLQDLGIEANLKLYPPELDMRVDRQARAEGAQAGPMEPSLVRHGGAATTRDDFVRVATHWRVRRQPAQEWDAGVLEPADPSCDGGVGPDGGFCAPQPLLDEGPKGQWVERYCGELPGPRTPEQLALCLKDDSELAEVPAGVPPLAGRVVRITGSAAEEPAVASFPIPPGSSTSTVQTSLRLRERDGRVAVLNNLPRANYYVQVVGHPVLPRDRNRDGIIDPSEENAPPPDFTDGDDAPGLPERAMALKNVYRSLDPEGKMERYDRAREHEFRVLEVGSAQVTAKTDRGDRPVNTGSGSATPPRATQDDLAYQFLLNLIEPEDPGRAGTLSGKYALRLGSDSFGIECPIEIDVAQGLLRGTCEGEYLPEVISASDILYLELYLKGNAENVLYRFNFEGLSLREDYVGAASSFTAARAVEQKDGMPVEDRPVSRAGEAHFFLSPGATKYGRLRLCTTEDCAEGTLIKEAYVQWEPANGTYAMQETQGKGLATAPLVQEEKSGAGGARHFRQSLPATLAKMPGSTNEPAPVYLVVNSLGPVIDRIVRRLGHPEGRFQGMHSQAAGQEFVEGINLASLSLSFTHTDFVVPHYAGAMSFSRTYNNQNDRLSAVGLGWSHGYDGFVIEEKLGRYAVVLGGQAWGVLRCDEVDRQRRTARQCWADQTHSMELEVDAQGVKVTTAQGHVYRFDRPAVRGEGEERRMWLLTRFHDGHGRADGNGWTQLTYAPKSNRLTKVKRVPGVLELEFRPCEDLEKDDCENLPADASAILKALARSEDFKLVKAVVLKSGADVLHVVRFKHDKWGNLLEAVRETDPPTQRWEYTYAPVPAGVEDSKASRALNELKTARFEVSGQRQWSAEYERNAPGCYAHLEPFECVGQVRQTGYQGPIEVQGTTSQRQVLRPGEPTTIVGLNDYGNATSVQVGSLPAEETAWASTERQGKVLRQTVRSPGGRVLEYIADARMRVTAVKLKTKPSGSADVEGLPAGTALFTISAYQNGQPQAGTVATARGPVNWASDISAAGDVKRLSYDSSNGQLTLFTREMDDEGRVVSETDARGLTTTYTLGGPLGLPSQASVSVTGSSGGLDSYSLSFEYDRFGRLIKRRNTATGAEESWTYDGQGNVLRRARTGSPSEVWTYSYSYGDARLTVEEKLEGVTYTRTAVFEEGLLKSETLNYGGTTPSATRSYSYEGRRLRQKTDERGITWTYDYDANGRLKEIKAGGKTAESYALDVDGNVTTLTDREGRATQIGYDALGKPVSWTYEDGHQETARRDAQGAIVWSRSKSQDAPEHILEQEVDVLGRVLSTQSAASGSAGGVDMRATYDTAGRVLTREDRVAGLSETFEYGDALGRLTRHLRKVQAQAGLQNWEETRSYSDSAGISQIQIARTIDGASAGQRQEQETLWVDTLGRVLSAERPGAGKTDYTYDARGNVLTRTHPIKGQSTYSYDGLGNLLSETAPGSVTIEYTTDATGLVLTQSGPHEQEHWTFTYDAFSRPLTRTLRQGGSTPAAAWTFSYPGEGQVIETTPLGKSITRRFNSRELLLSESLGTQAKEYAYDGAWERSEKVVEGGSVLHVTRSFDDRGRALWEQEQWTGGGGSYTYRTELPWQGRTVTRRDSWEFAGAPPQVRQAQMEVDGLGNVVSVTQGGQTDAWSYDAGGLLASEALAGKPVRLFTYEQDRLVGMQYGGEQTVYGYDGAGRLESETDPSGRRRAREYDARGLVKRESFGRGTETLSEEYTYDKGGFLETLTRGAAVTSFTHGPRGELQRVALPGGLGEFTYGYDAALQLKTVTPPAGGMPAQTFGYDDLGRPTSRTRGPSAWTTVWADGVSTTTDPNGNIEKRVHDGRGRVVRQEYKPGSSSVGYTDLTAVSYAYDGLDQLLMANETRGSGNVSNVYGYDARSRLTSISRTGGSGPNTTVSYSYTASGQRSTVTSPSGMLTYDYDGLDRLKSVVSSQGPAVTVKWEPGGGLLTEVSGNGVTERYTYDGAGNVRSITALQGGGISQLTRYEYDYDGRGNRLEERYQGPVGAAVEVTQYGYDLADRLTGVRYPSGQAELYALAPDGTRLFEKQATGYTGDLGPGGWAQASNPTRSWRYFYDTAGGLQRIEDLLIPSRTEASFITDATGQVTREERGNTSRTYWWDAAGRLAKAQVITPDELVESLHTYGFDGLRRRSLTIGGADTHYVWGANEELLEEGLSWGTRKLYARAEERAVAVGNERLLTDALGSVVGRVGASVKLSRYGAWGALREGDAPGESDPTLAYAGQHFGSNVGLSYAQQRWYDPNAGRFLSEDPVFGSTSLPTSLHPWAYGNSNPTLYTDPSGRFGVIGAAVGGALGFIGGCIYGALSKDKECLAFGLVGATAGAVAGATFGVGLAAMGGTSTGAVLTSSTFLTTTGAKVAIAGTASGFAGGFTSGVITSDGATLRDRIADGLAAGVRGGIMGIIAAPAMALAAGYGGVAILGAGIGFDAVDQGISIAMGWQEGFDWARMVSAGVTSISPVRRYQVLREERIQGTKEAQHKRSANKGLVEAMKNNPRLEAELGKALGVDKIIGYMKPGKGRLRNPPGETDWHHPLGNPDVVQLLTRKIHKDKKLQKVLHPLENGRGGYETYYGAHPIGKWEQAKYKVLYQMRGTPPGSKWLGFWGEPEDSRERTKEP
jgi:RHS repeat-associated protein